MKSVDVLILGAGAAGLMCGAQAGYRGKSVLIIDHAPKAAAKIRISGGGKCNFTNVTVRPEHYLCQNPHFVKSALSSYSSQAFVELVERHGIDYEVREGGKYFCLKGAGQIIQMLRTECDWAGNEVWLNTEVNGVDKDSTGYRVATSQGEVACQSLVVATGGLSFPKLRASDLGYRLAEQFHINTLPLRPGLVPLELQGRWLAFAQGLSGQSLPVSIRLPNNPKAPTFEEAMLFTHTGLSGPAILQASNYWFPGDPIEINLFPANTDNETADHFWLSQKASGQTFSRACQSRFPKKFCQAWSQAFTVPDRLAEVSHETLSQLSHEMSHWTLYPKGMAGYDKAEVTLGGVDTDALSSKDMQVKDQPGLFFIGEVLDVTGHLGGFNFQWAWASAVAAAKAV